MLAPTPRKILIVGGGIAGLCAAVYARRCGYEIDLFEKHDTAGGLATSWRSGDYTFETCLHWLVGSHPNGTLHAQWQEVLDIDSLTFVDPEEFVRLETEHGECLSVYTNVDRLEAEFLRRAPQDAVEIRRFASAIRNLSNFPMPDLTMPWPGNWLALLQALPYLPLLRWWSRISIEEYGGRFMHPLLRGFFAGGELGGLSALALVFSLAWMNARNAGYPIGGSQAVIRGIVGKLHKLGAQLRLGCNVERILVERDTAVGVQLTGGETVTADWVISAADGHATIYDLLGGRYTDAITDKSYARLETFPSYLQVSLGVRRDLSQQGGYVTRLLDAPLSVDPGTVLSQVSFRFFHFDPTFAPRGETAVTCFLPTRNFAFWVNLRQYDPARYQAEKQRVAEAVIGILERMLANVRDAIEVTDVATPATVIRYTGNWKGSMEGWFLSPAVGFRPLRNSLPGLRRFLMVGQWVMPGGGLPSGLMTARSAIQAVCKQDRVPFLNQHAFERNQHAV
jgi:phytoene dehydrogenase-like protein